MAPEYGATCGFFPVTQATIDYLAATGRDAGAGGAGRGLRQGAGPLARARRARAGVHRHPGARPRHGRALAGRAEAAAGPGRAGRRGGQAFARRAGGPSSARTRRAPRRACRSSGETLRPRQRRRGDRRHHLLHQHLQPQRADRRRPAGQERGRQGAEGQAVGEDLAGARLAGGHRLSGQGRPAPSRSTRWASTWSATAAPPASATPGRCPSRSPRRSRPATWWPCRVLSGNRNFEGRVNPDTRANYLASPPLVVAYALAGSMQIDLDQRAARRRARAARTSILKDIWPTTEGHRRRCRRRSVDRAPCSPSATATSSRATSTGRASRSPAARPTPGTSARPTCRTRPTSRA